MLTKPRIDVYLVFNYTYLTRDQKCGPGSLLLPGYTSNKFEITKGILGLLLITHKILVENNEHKWI